MARPRHPHKEIEAAVADAETRGWRLRKSKKGHAWGVLLCPFADTDGCQHSVLSTPKSSETFAKRLRKLVGKCAHARDEENVP